MGDVPAGFIAYPTATAAIRKLKPALKVVHCARCPDCRDDAKKSGMRC